MASGGTLEVKMPHMGVSVTEGTVTTWLKAVGDDVAAEEPVCEVSTDKVDTEVPAPAAGRVAEILVAEGDTVEVGTPLALLAVDGAEPATAGEPGREGPAADAPSPEAALSTISSGVAPPEPVTAGGERPDAAVPAVAEDVTESRQPRPGRFDHAAAFDEVTRRTGDRQRPLASPVARRIAGAHAIELSTIAGTGARGRIRKSDVLAAIAQGTAPGDGAAAAEPRAETVAAPPAPEVAAEPGRAPAQPAPAAPAEPSAAPAEPSAAPAPGAADGLPAGYEDVPYEIVPTSRIRRVTAEHMIRSRQTAAHMTTEADVDLQRLTDVRAAVNAKRAAEGRAKLSYLPFIARAAAAALREHPDLNATFQLERFIRWREFNFGIAVDTPQGLLVPVIRGCENLTVDALGERIVEVAESARAKQLTADDFRGGTFTISNPGSVGAVSAMAIINQPQVAILGIPTIVRKPWVVTLPDGGETIAIRPILRLAITFDHRAIDGAEATRCVVLLKRHLEAWGEQDYR